MAFVFGKTMGRTKLIKLSPNKTVEGFVGGGISTIIFAIFVSIYLKFEILTFIEPNRFQIGFPNFSKLLAPRTKSLLFHFKP